MKRLKLTKEEEKELLNSLPVFIRTTTGKLPTEKQLKNLISFLKEDIIKKRK
jgi:hypothetical protein